MDPQANLKEQRELAAKLVYQIDHGITPDETDTDRLAQLVIDLDNWIMGGGFLPADWQASRKAPDAG